MEVGGRCPNCGSRQFSISLLPKVFLHEALPTGFLGIGDCRDCQEEFMVKFSQCLYNAVAGILNDYPDIKEQVLKFLFSG